MTIDPTLHLAAASALTRFTEAPPAAARIERLSVEVRLGEAHEFVSLRLLDGQFAWSCTCAQENCVHASAALSLLASLEASGVEKDGEVEAAVREGRTAIPSDRPERADNLALAEALEDVLTAVVRVGIRSLEAPSIGETLERLVHAAPEPLPLGISRWVGRLDNAIAARDIDTVARILDGAARLADDLRAAPPGAAAKERILSWLGALAHDPSGVYQISDRTMLEVAREFLDGVERGAIERRYLLDLDSGDVYSEERPRGRPLSSLGTCPRVVHVGLAEVERTAEPRRIRLLQYVSVPVVTEGHWGAMLNWAVRSFGRLPDRFCEASEAFPGLAEPFVVVAPDSYMKGQTASLIDDGGKALPLTPGREPAVIQYIDEQTTGRAPSWVAGRLVDVDGVIMLRPVSLGHSHNGRTDHVRI
ncbi:MAG: hypothetical protein OXR73_02500 [Myxococcales bacterium]|nr:hypothetical protein [Myxococcales bacterium]